MAVEIPWFKYQEEEGWVACSHGVWVLYDKNTPLVWEPYDTDFCHDCGKPLNSDLSLLDTGGIIDRCPGCLTKIEGRRDRVESIIKGHRRDCREFQDWESEQRLRLELGKLS